MFRIKICGITNVDDALAAAAAGADAIGLNFYARSRRRVSIETAAEIAAVLPPGVQRVGVFVHATADEITRIVEAVPLDAVQLHGNEPPELIAQLPAQVTVIRAHRCGEEGLEPLALYLQACESHGRRPDGVLVDADSPAEYGGSGSLADWTQVAQQRELVGDLPLVLAGGLTPENVADAIATVHPDGVDVASGVESRPGQKDGRLVARFIAAARDALAAARG